MPRKPKLTHAVLKKIKSLQKELDDLRKLYEISAKDECVWHADLNSVDDRLVIVEADGLGGATCMQVRGNYPDDYLTEHSRDFLTETDATTFASSVTDEQFGNGSWEDAEKLWDAPEPTGN